MKQIEAVIRPFKLDAAPEQEHMHRMTVFEVMAKSPFCRGILHRFLAEDEDSNSRGR